MSALHPKVAEVTERIHQRSEETRRDYLERIRAAARRGPRRIHMACSNLAHAWAGTEGEDRSQLRGGTTNVGIVSAYNDMLSAHQPFMTFPGEIKLAVRQEGGVAQFAGGVPAMCDGVTQGETGMELSLFSRDVIAMSTAIALSHDVFDAGICLGVCDKIVPGLFIGALSFGHLPFVFMPAGPMPSGLPNKEKQRVRQLYAEGKVSRADLMAAEEASYHSPGTCTFFGTANSNQMFMELMGLHLPGASFENPGSPLRKALTAAGARRAVSLARIEGSGVGEMIDERSIVNAVVGLLATGGSTNHTIHLIAMAAAAGVSLEWEDLDDLSAVVPLLARVYPNGNGDVNAFHQAGGLAFLISQLLAGGLVHEDVQTVAEGEGLEPYTRPVSLVDNRLTWTEPRLESADDAMLRPISNPFQSTGGLRLLHGNLGRSVIKTSAIPASKQGPIEAPALIFDSQSSFEAAFKEGRLDRDLVAVVRFQGPRANGMPELHKLMSPLGVLQDRGYRVALVTDGRLSGASGKVPAAIHVTPEAATGGPLARLRDGDLLRVDAERGLLEALVEANEFERRPPAIADDAANAYGLGRELFAGFRAIATRADRGARSFGVPPGSV
ncbi:MAG: phosphogluconate dehydratase [Thermoanaerobaculia bacterium]|nr:phosphogluconate dehydratase [Thermoanaerobaculia bacterium]